MNTRDRYRKKLKTRVSHLWKNYPPVKVSEKKPLQPDETWTRERFGTSAWFK
jgi:hypothetical protein